MKTTKNNTRALMRILPDENQIGIDNHKKVVPPVDSTVKDTLRVHSNSIHENEVRKADIKRHIPEG